MFLSCCRESQQSAPLQKGCYCSESLKPVSKSGVYEYMSMMFSYTCYTFSYMVQIMCVRVIVLSCLCSCSTMSINILCCSLQSWFCLFHLPNLQQHWDLNPKLLGTVISCSLPSFSNYCYRALEQDN